MFPELTFYKLIGDSLPCATLDGKLTQLTPPSSDCSAAKGGEVPLFLSYECDDIELRRRARRNLRFYRPQKDIYVNSRIAMSDLEDERVQGC